LFSHSRISDKGQIVEISILNRGFKTEEQIDVSLNPQMHYELIGSNNPDAALNGAKLSIPRIGSADDCSVLLQADNGKFSHEDIVNCLSKESKGVVVTKLEELPLTAQQRVGAIGFVAILVLIGAIAFKGFDLYVENTKQEGEGNTSAKESAAVAPLDLQGWSISKAYTDEPMYRQILDKDLKISLGASAQKGRVMSLPISVFNGTDKPISLSAWVSSTVEQDGIDYERKRVNNRLVLPGGKLNMNLQAAIGAEESDRGALLEVFLTQEGGGSLKASRMVFGQ